MNRARTLAAGLTLSASAFVAILSSEGYVEVAAIPTKNDRPTNGFGSTFKEDGTPVRLGERITPVRAVQRAAIHIGKEEAVYRSSIATVPLYPAEYDLYMDWTYQYGAGAWSKSSMRRHLQAGQYRAACNALLRYKFSGGYDCSTPGNRICAGVWDRQLARHKKCMEAQ